MKICLVRHGQTEWNTRSLLQGHTDNSLNEKGKLQAKAVGEFLKIQDPNWDVIASSPLKRARETAQIIAKTLHFQNEVMVLEEFIERDFGDLEGETLSPEIYDLLEQGENGIETESNLKKRAIEAVKNLANRYPNQNVLVCSHAQFIKAVISSLDPAFSFRSLLENSSVNYFSYENNLLSIEKINIVPSIG